MEWRQEALEGIKERLCSAGMKAELHGGMVQFLVNDIADREEWKVIGEASFVPYIPTGEQEDILQVYLTLAQNLDETLYGRLAIKLMELNDGVMFGRLGLNEYKQLYYLSRIPVVENNAKAAAKMFEFVTYEMFTFLDAFYAYILVIINEPDKLELKRYMELMLEDKDEADEE